MSSPHTSSAVVFSKWLQAALSLHHYSVLSVQGQLVVNSRTLRPSVSRPQELNVWPGAAFWQAVGPMVIVLVHVIAAMFMSLVGESGAGASTEGEMCWASP